MKTEEIKIQIQVPEGKEFVGTELKDGVVVPISKNICHFKKGDILVNRECGWIYMFSHMQHTNLSVHSAYFNGICFITNDEGTNMSFANRSRKATEEEISKFWEAAEDAGYFYINDKWHKLPETWEEYQSNRPCFIDVDASRERSLEALRKLIHLRDEYRQGWVPDYDAIDFKYSISNHESCIVKDLNIGENRILSFQSTKIRDKFLENFEDLIELAKDLI